MKGSYYFISISLNLLLTISFIVVETKIVTTYAQHPNNNGTETPATAATQTNVKETPLLLLLKPMLKRLHYCCYSNQCYRDPVLLLLKPMLQNSTTAATQTNVDTEDCQYLLLLLKPMLRDSSTAATQTNVKRLHYCCYSNQCYRDSDTAATQTNVTDSTTATQTNVTETPATAATQTNVTVQLLLQLKS